LFYQSGRHQSDGDQNRLAARSEVFAQSDPVAHGGVNAAQQAFLMFLFRI